MAEMTKMSHPGMRHSIHTHRGRGGRDSGRNHHGGSGRNNHCHGDSFKLPARFTMPSRITGTGMTACRHKSPQNEEQPSAPGKLVQNKGIRL